MSGALSVALLELATLGILGVPALVMQPGQGFSLWISALVGAVLGRLIVSRWMLPREESLSRPAEWTWSLGVGAGWITRTALLVTAGAVLLELPLLWLLPSMLILGWALSGRWRGLEGLLFVPIVVGLGWSLWELGSSLTGGWDVYGKVLMGSRKHLPWNLAIDAATPATLWSGLTLGTINSMVLLGADPLVRARLAWSGTLEGARRALWFSLVYLLPLAGLVGIGVALFAWQERQPISADGDAWVLRMQSARSRAAMQALGIAFLLLALQGVIAWMGHGQGRMRVLRQAWLAAGLLVLLPTMDHGLLGAQVAWGVVGACWLLRRLQVEPSPLDWAWALALVVTAALALHDGATAWLRPALIAMGLAWFASRTLVEYFGHRRRLAALVDTALVVGLCCAIDWLARHNLVPVARNRFHDEGWNWLPLSSAWYVPLCGGAFFALCCWFARERAGQRGTRG